jgi:hypothetical protein
MLTTLVAALSLAVPYLPQTDALCGGAAAAMVFRYWGDAHADVAPFAPLVEKRPGGVVGIPDNVLVDAIEKRGWRALRMNGSLDLLHEQLQQRHPIIVLVADRGPLNHFLVVTGIDGDTVVVHDPTWGPSRRLPAADFERVWRATNFWSLVVLPGGTSAAEQPEEAHGPSPDPGDVSVQSSSRGSMCDRLLESAIDESANRAPSEAYEIVNRVRLACPAEAGPIRELAGIRFAERRWRDAADLSETALEKDATDRYAWDVLASSRFLLNDIEGALRAWNQIAKPNINLVNIDGLARARFKTIAEVIGLRPNTLLTERQFRLAERRLASLPDRSASRLTIRPEPDGFATVQATLVEREAAPRGVVAWAAATLDAGINRHIRASLPGSTGQGEVWTASWRWSDRRPRIAGSFAAPHTLGVVGVEGAWESQRYESGGDSTRTHGALSLKTWLTPDIRYSVTGGFDSWHGDREGRSLFAGGSLEHRWQRDRWSLGVDGMVWIPVGSEAPFQTAGLRAGFRSSGLRSSAAAFEGWVFLADAGVMRASDRAPSLIWPRAGEGQDADILLRAHPIARSLKDDDRRSVFGRGLAYSHAEAQRWIASSAPVSVGLAAFADAARVSHPLDGTPSDGTRIDIGGGVRLRIPGSAGILRVDVAHGIRDNADALTVGWQF